ncbi:DUF4250 domain-containing protein [Psychromonas arctica]|uniref:DUF4250 domain-containing protein n=1 Tax=Psychromonas arctica TaxID=168275 RepID=UPI002FD14048
MLENYQKMDVNMLLSIVNMKLRNEQKTLDDLCSTYEMDKPMLKARLASAGFIYDLSNHQFKQSIY